VAGNPVELADGGDESLAVGSVEAFRDVEDEIGPRGLQAFREVLVRLEPDDLAELRQRALDGIDRLGLIPLGVKIRLIQFRMQSAASMTGILRFGGESFGSAGGGKGRLEVER
jgi:hypothetical protein